MRETIHFEYLGCEWYVDVYIERDDAVTPGSVSVDGIDGYAEGTMLPGELVGYVYEAVSKRAIEEASRG